ncbi:hypothetical protein N8584_00540 [bacterium]|nr:hypothetical protein [bacterium]
MTDAVGQNRDFTYMTLSKLVNVFMKPIGFIWMILLLAIVRALYKKQAGLARMEKQYAVDSLEVLPECDAVVVLGSGHSFKSKGVFDIEFNGAVDRIYQSSRTVACVIF